MGKVKFEFKKATKEQSKLRLAIFGPSGGGKTFTALRLAAGIGGNIAVIDTERGSASKYSDRFDFDVLELDEKDIDSYCGAIEAAGDAGYPVLIVDSLSHAWKELLQEVEQLAQAKYRGNTWSAWSKGTPRQMRLVNAILEYPGHIIATMRSKTEWVTDSEGGKTKPTRVGLAPEQGKGIEYEFDLLMELTTEHVATVIKDRTGKFQDKIMDKPGEDFGKALVDWLSDGIPPRQKPERNISADTTLDAPSVFKNPDAAMEWVKEQLGINLEEAATVYSDAKKNYNPESATAMRDALVATVAEIKLIAAAQSELDQHAET